MQRQLNIIHGDLVTKRTQLVPLSEEHLEDIYRIYSDYDVIQYTDNNLHFSKEDTQKYIENIKLNNASGNSLFWVIRLHDINKIIGTVSLYHIDGKHYFASVGCLLERAFWRQGLMFEVLRKIIQHAFEVNLLNRIEAQIYVGHEASVNLFEKLKFTKEAILRENFQIEWKLEDSYMYSLLQRDYLKIKLYS